ncbi:glycosyltransferase family 4 protein [Porphyromonas gingivalis]|uniref:glycosyltransferase family 4 protein n=1 Tax=Porphyromonas gingivalis TaxID=837 RepID=UPI0006BA9BE7|nr:glycosyltransferase family 4 protein [Porphyromonas gingivalis]PDP65507.1 glycosyl transferase family 1 [Porphyromonas gingivalis]RRG13954.1 glycosyltransferase [Porphyromonas gingivalis]
MKKILCTKEAEKIDGVPILSIGCNYKPVRGGIAQVLDIYDKYIFKDFHFIANSGGGGLRNVWKLLSSICLLIKQLLSKREIKIVHIHTASYNSFYRSAIFVLLSKLLGRKVILHIHGGGFKDFYKTNPRLIRKILGTADCLIVLSGSWKHFFESITKKPLIRVVPNPVILPSNEDLDRREHSPLLRLLFLGLLDQQKGIYDLLQVLADHKEEFEGRILLNVGGNGDVATFENTVKKMGLEQLVAFHGWVSGDKKKELLLNSDVFILPSYAEGLPMAVLEAMAYGLVIVSTIVGAIPEVVSQDYGYLIVPGDKGMLTEVLLTLVSDRSFLEKQRLSKEASKEYSVEEVAKCLCEIYQEI